MTVTTLSVDERVEFLEGRLSIPDDLSFDDWMLLGESLRFRERNVGWWLGDWWRFGEHRYGERSAQAVEVGYALSTIQAAARTAERVEPARRRATLPYSVHAEVAMLTPEEQEQELDVAEAAAVSGTPLTRERVRERVRQRRDAADPNPGVAWTMVCDQCYQAGPGLICRENGLRVNRGLVCGFLRDHEQHDIRVLNERSLKLWWSAEATTWTPG